MEEENSKYAELYELCPMLFDVDKTGKKHSCGFECGGGWYYPIKKLCVKLEMLNVQYSKYGVRIIAEQIKEKFGTLRFYHGFKYEETGLLTRILAGISRALSGIDYGIKTVVDKKSFTEYVETEISKPEYVKTKKEQRGNAYNLKEKDGKFFKTSSVFHAGKTHVEITRFRLLHALNEFLRNKMAKAASETKCDSKVELVVCHMDGMAEDFIRTAEDECSHYCEICGAQIGSAYSPACETTGWITYLCEKCAIGRKLQYYKNGELCENGKILKTKKQIAAERAAACLQIKEKRKKEREAEKNLNRELAVADSESSIKRISALSVKR